MRTSRAAIAGIAGALVMSLAMALARLLGVPVSLEAMLGSLFGVEGTVAWMAGFALHLAMGAVVAIVYAVGFEYAVQRSGIAVGAALGVAHGLLAGLFMTAIPAMNPLVATSPLAPGPFFARIEYGPALFLALHALFGAVVGIVYGPVMHKPHLISRSRPA
jgi:hypothetical protein